MRKRDTQRSKVYAWENKLFGRAAKLELAECQQIVNAVGRHYGLKRMATVTDGRGRRRACYAPSWNQIKLPRWSRQRYIVIHEAAHWIETKLWPGEVAWHGREFMGIYMHLLCRFHDQDFKDLARSVNDARIDFESRDRCNPRGLKKFRSAA